MIPPPAIDEYAFADHLEPEVFDALLANGWRHFGEYFFRYSTSLDPAGDPLTIQPLRLDLAAFTPGKSQRRCLRRNADLTVILGPARHSDELAAMFHAHKQRFTTNVPDTLADFLGPEPGSVVPCLMVEARLGDRLLAASFLDLGRESVSGVYAIFDPAESARGLGTFTLLVEILWAAQSGYRFHYPGYATREPSAYDYKKRFRGLAVLDWETASWHPLPPAG